MLLNSERRIRTVCGDISPQSLGHIQCHEHIYLRKGPGSIAHPALCMEDLDRSARELSDYRAAGGSAIVDAQPGFFGRDPEKLQALSQRTGVAIIAVTGFHKLAFLEDAAYTALPEQQLLALFTGEITEGMLNPAGIPTGIRAGLVKAAFEEGGLSNPIYRKLLSAAAGAAADTGVSILVHTEKNTDIWELLRFFQSFGIAPARVLICHLDRTRSDAGYHKALLQSGCYLCYDSINRTKYLSHAAELALLKDVLSDGWEDQIVLSLDTTNERLRAYNAKDMGLDYILQDYIPILRKNGITDEQLCKMCRINSAKILTMQINLKEKQL